MKAVSSVIAALTVAMLFQLTQAADATLNTGDKAPSFTVADDTGADWNAADHFGKKIVVVYFYPADMTGGCTRQACGFRDDMEKLKELGVEVVGVSGDRVRNHQIFKKVHNLNFTLLSDTEGKVAKAFGVPFMPGERTIPVDLDGMPDTLTRMVTIQRWTFVVGPDGKVAYKNEKVNPAEDSKKVAEVVQQLKGSS